MTIAQNVASKLSVALVAAAMIFSMFAPAVKAQTTEELQKMINDLLAQVAALQGSTGNASGAGGTCVSIPAPLTLGASGANVKALQERLIAGGSSIPAGATGYFGEQTRSALAAWQTAKGISPAAGYYGPVTMAAMDASCTPVDDADDEDEDDSDDSDSADLQGEGSLDTFEIDDASDDEVQEGSEDAVIAELTVEATDGDIEIDRMDLALTNVDGSDDAWDVFETISIWVDGDMIAEFDASDEDNYLDEDDGTFRFTGLGLVAMEDEEVEVLVGATVVSSVDDTMPNTWTVEVNKVRYFDADGVSDDDSATGDIEPFSGSAPVATFDIVEAGDGEELKFGLGDNNPDATDIVVDEDKKTTGVTILEYTIEAQEGDIELNNLFVNLVATGATYAQIVDDVAIVIDGEEFDGETPDTANGSTTVEFEIDGDVTIDEDAEVTVEVVVDFKSVDGSLFTNGDKIQARVRSDETDATDAEGMDDVDEFSGTAIGDTHTLVATGILVPVDGVEVTSDTKGDNDQTGEFTIEFEVTAVEGDFYITDNVSSATSATDGVAYIVDLGTGTATTSGVLSSTADEDTDGVYTVEEGETETFTLTVTVDTSATTQARVILAEINYSADADGLSGTAYVPTPASDYRTDYENINAN